jgi:dGTPase
MDEELADALAAFRQGNYEQVYFRPASVSQGEAVIAMLRGLVEHFADQPNRIPGVDEAGGLAGGSGEAVAAAVAYVAGMTDRFAMASAVTDLGWDLRSLPRGIEDIGHG